MMQAQWIGLPWPHYPIICTKRWVGYRRPMNTRFFPEEANIRRYLKGCWCQVMRRVFWCLPGYLSRTYLDSPALAFRCHSAASVSEDPAFSRSLPWILKREGQV